MNLNLDQIAEEAAQKVLQAMKPNVKIVLSHEKAQVPTYATDGSGCFDIFALGSVSIPCLQAQEVRTGLLLEIPENWVMLVFSRSGHAFSNNVRLANCVGVIDSDYRGELRVKLRNDGVHTLNIPEGKAVAQAMLVRRELVTFDIVDTLSDTKRGTGGFGSTDGAPIMTSRHLEK